MSWIYPYPNPFQAPKLELKELVFGDWSREDD